MKRQKIYSLVLLAILSAIIIIQSFVPGLGNIPIPPITPTIIHITVIVGTLLLGLKQGMLLGTVWGICSLLRAWIMPPSPITQLLFGNPIIAILPRIAVAITAFYIFKLLFKKLGDTYATMIAAVIGSLTNTLLVCIFIYLIYSQQYANLLNIDVSGLWYVLATLIATSGLAEAGVAGVLVPLLKKPLSKLKS